MAVGVQPQANLKDNGKEERPGKRILIEASKLADENMDGIKRYVVELLKAISESDLDGSGLEIDVMILDDVYPLGELPGEGLPGGKDAPIQNRHHYLHRALGGLVPPILLHLVKWLIPDWASRRFLGKKKADLQVPVLELSGRNAPALVLPPLMTQFLWARGILEPPPKAVDPDPYDLIHFTLPNNHHYIRPTPAPLLVTVHDLCHIACPQYQTRANSITLRMGLERAVARDAHFLSVSGATSEQMITEFGLDPDRVDTVHNGCSAEHFHPVRDPEEIARICRKYHIPESPFLLALSTIEPRKNLARTIEAFELMVRESGDTDTNLVIAGARGWKSQKIMSTAKASRQILLTGYIEDEDLAAIYSSARGFVYASHYEGFGLPLLEAMHCGLPVIYGNNSSMPEIVGDAGLAVDSGDVHDIARQMRRLVCDVDLAGSMGRRALERARGFSWDQTAAQTLAVYRKLLD